MKKIGLFLLASLCLHVSFAQQKSIAGSVLSAIDQTPLAGVNILIKGSSRGTSTDADGRFSIEADDKDILIVSFIGFNRMEVPVNTETVLTIELVEDVSTLGEITIVSTGYQQLPKERVNGSFVQVDNALLNRRVSTNVLARLEDVTSGLIINRSSPKTNDISIRGLSTINSTTQPLIVIDNFPYEGDINTLNPNDVESVTVLKDAAAASIWGARAGNGVIVITTKRGGFSEPLKVSFNSNVTVASKPDLFYVSRMSSSDVLENEASLFEAGFYAAKEASWSSPISPGVELMIANRDGLLSDSDYQSQLATLAKHDVRSEYDEYLQRESVNQQYALSLNGGNASHRYYFSAGWDKNNENLVGNSLNRITLNMTNTWAMMHDKLHASAAVYISENNTVTNNPGFPDLPVYARLKDASGNNLPVTKDYRQSFIKQAKANGLLDWSYSPLDEINRVNNASKLLDYRVNTTLHYKIMEGLNAELLYQYWRGNTSRRKLYAANSYFARNLINQYSSLADDETVVRAIPLGGILDEAQGVSENQSFRSVLTYNKSIGRHELSALAGYEARLQDINSSTHRYYGYDDETATIAPVDYKSFFPRYDYESNFSTIPYADDLSVLTDRFISWFGNASYTFADRYSISASARRDQSNLFGVRANQRAVPLWSAGVGYTISEESFYGMSWLPLLKVRATYGANGNINKQVTAFTTSYTFDADEATGLPYSLITYPANPDLRWERVNALNVGVDFAFRNQRLTGSVELYNKHGIDLIGASPMPPSKGVTTFTGNTASIRTRGMDIVLNSINVNRALRWQTTILFSHARDKVTDYKNKPEAFSLLTAGAGTDVTVAPLQGKPLFGIYSYQTTGLDPLTGDPQGMLGGQPSTNYKDIVTEAKPADLVYHGPARPTIFGSLRNTLSWKNISMSFNISYRFNYFFRRSSVIYSQVLNGMASHGDYALRWKKPGDEKFTTVPSLPSEVDSYRDDLYMFSAALVEKGDHIRLQDITLSYALNQALIKRLPVTRIELYSYANNIGILWKATSSSLDPDFLYSKPVRSIAFGVRVDF